MAEQQPPPAAEKKMKVMVAIDDSENSFYALQWVIDNFSDLITIHQSTAAEGGMLTLVHVQQPFQQFAFPAGPGGATASVYMSSSMLESVRKAQLETSAALFARALEMCRKKKIHVETLALEGDPKDVLCQIVEEMHIQLLVVGSRGLGKIKRAFLGSVSDYCAHHAKCPILIVKPPKEMTK